MAVQHKTLGFDVSDEIECVIASGQSLSAIVDMGRNFSFIGVACDDTDGLADAGTLTAILVSPYETGTMRVLYGVDFGVQVVSAALEADDEGTFQTVITQALGMRRIQFQMSAITTAEVTLKLTGFYAGKDYP